MNIGKDSLGKEKRALTRADVEERLRQVGSSRRLNLANETLAYSDLSNLNLTGAILVGADLTGANLSEAILSEAKLTGAIFNRANLSNAILTKTILNAASLVEASLLGADLIGANLDVATLIGADLSRANLTRAKLNGAKLMGATLRGANLTRAKLNGAKLMGATLWEANLNKTNLSEADLSEAHFDETSISKAIFSEASISTIASQEVRLDQISLDEQIQQLNTEPTLRLRIEEKPLTAYHLSEVLNFLISLYVKMWLLQRHRLDDFLLYNERGDQKLEKEANLLIAELKYNSPADIKFNFDFSPQSFVEAFQRFVEMIAYRRHRERTVAAESHSKNLDNQLKMENVKQEQLKTINQCLESAKSMVEAMWPELDGEQKAKAINGLFKDMLKITQDPTLELSLTVPSTFLQLPPVTQLSIKSEQPAGQLLEGAASSPPKEAN